MSASADPRTLTVLFTDVEGSTELLSREGDRVAGEILGVHEQIVRDQITVCGGREEAFLGDGFLATFTSPTDALRCSVEIQRALELHNLTATHPVRVRLGVHMGEVTRRGGQIYGRAVHATARIMAEAAGGEILVSSVVKAGLDGHSDGLFEDMGLFWLKGFPERWRLYRVDWGATSDAPLGGRAGALSPFVGRDAERADLRRPVRSAIAGHGGVVLVSGEPGVGKTRLIEEVATEAENRRMRVLVGHCVEMEGVTPYLPFVEILEAALISPRSPAVYREALGELAPEIARLVPGLGRFFPDLALPLELPPEQARRYLWDSVAEFLRRISQAGSLLLVLEDLHWGDESTFHLLGYLAPLVAEMPVLIVASYRDTEVGPAHPLAPTLQELTRRRLAERISLSRLSPTDVTTMVTGLAEQAPPAALIDVIQSETEGNPFFVEEVYLHLLESGALFDTEGRFKTRIEVDEVDVPETVRLVIGIRLQRLSRTTRDVLLAAAISGRVFDPEVVRRVADLPGDELARAYEEAESAHLISPTRADPNRSAFVHELIRQTLLAEASLSRRQSLHAATTAAIEEVYVDTIGDHAADLVHHLSRSGSPASTSRLAHYLVVAGDRAVQAAAFEDGVDYFHRALAIVEDTELDRRAELQERLAMAQRSVGDWDDALVTMDQSLELYERLGRREDVGRICSSVVYQLAWAARFEEAMAVAQRGMQVLGDLPNPDRARLLAVTGWVLGLAGDHDGAAATFDQARRLTEELADERARADVLHMETAHHMGYVEFEEGADSGLQAADVLEREGSLWDLCSVCAFVAYQLGTMGRRDEAVATASRVSAIARRIGHLGAQFLLVADRARREGVMAGNGRATDALGREMIEICERGKLPWLYTGYMYRGFAAAWAGRGAEAGRLLGRAMELEPPGAFTGQSGSLLAMLLAEEGRADEVLVLLDQNRAVLPTAGQVNSLGSWNTLFGFIEALYLAGRAEEAGGFLPLVQEALSLGFEWITFDCRLVHTRAALAAAGAGRWEESEDYFAAAQKAAEAMGHQLEQADILYLRARVLAERGLPEDAFESQALLDRAVERYRALELPGRVERAASFRRRLPVAESDGSVR